MKQQVEMEGVEDVVEKIWDLHDKLSDTIHSISRTHFVNSTQKSLKKPHFFDNDFNNYNNNANGFVFFKDVDKDSSIVEAKSLNSIRAALENLEEQLGFFHTVQAQQRTERDAALARLEQSRIILAVRLAEHHGKRYKVIDEALDFVGKVRDSTTCFREPDNLSDPPLKHCTPQKLVNSNIFVRFLFSGLDSAKKVLQLDKFGGVLGNAAIFAISMLAMLHIQQVTYKDNKFLHIGFKQDGSLKKLSQHDGYSSSSLLSPLDVRLARG